MQKNPGTQLQTDKDILQCRADILRAHEAITADKSDPPGESTASAPKTQVEPTEKAPAEAEQESQAKAKPPQEQAKTEEKPEAKIEKKAEAEKAEAEARAKTVQEAKAAAEKVLQEAKAKTEAAQEAITAAEKARAQAKVRAEARAKAEAEAKTAAEKAQQEATARAEAEQKAKAEAEARAKAEEELKVAAEKAQQEATAKDEADEEVIDIEELADLSEPAVGEADAAAKDNKDKDKTKRVEVASEDRSDEKAKKQIPQFDLAQQILFEQRRVASMRRSKSGKQASIKDPQAVTGTIGRIIRETKKKVGDISRTGERTQQLSSGVHGVIKSADNLNESQQETIAGIVTLDIARYCTDGERQGNARRSYSGN